jgi:hypothetical protein
MARKPPFEYHLDSKGIRRLAPDEIRMILRAADPLIASGGRTLLTKILKGSRAQDVLRLKLDECPAYGYYRHLSPEEILARIDWVIFRRYLAIEFSGRMPVLVYTPQGWAIEKETYAEELLDGFDVKLAVGGPPDTEYLKDRNREMIFLLLDKVRATRDAKYIPLLEAWEKIDYKKVRHRIRQVIDALRPPSSS